MKQAWPYNVLEPDKSNVVFFLLVLKLSPHYTEIRSSFEDKEVPHVSWRRIGKWQLKSSCYHLMKSSTIAKKNMAPVHIDFISPSFLSCLCNSYTKYEPSAIAQHSYKASFHFTCKRGKIFDATQNNKRWNEWQIFHLKTLRNVYSHSLLLFPQN